MPESDQLPNQSCQWWSSVMQLRECTKSTLISRDKNAATDKNASSSDILSWCGHVVGFALGDRENQDSWEASIQGLLERGINVQNLRLVNSDEHKGIESAVGRLLGVVHQLCTVHLLRNVKARVAAPIRKPSWRMFAPSSARTVVTKLSAHSACCKLTGKAVMVKAVEIV